MRLSGLVRSQVQLDIYAEQYAAVRALREQVVEAMRDTFPLANILVSEFEAFEVEPKLFRRVLTYSTAEQEGAASSTRTKGAAPQRQSAGKAVDHV